MSRLLRRSSRRHARRHPLQLALAILGVALGVAVVLGVDLALESSRTAFRLSTEAVTGRVTHQIVGGPGGLPMKNWAVAKELLPDSSIAVVEGPVRLVTEGSSTPLRLVGLPVPSTAAAGSTAMELPFELEIDRSAAVDLSRIPVLLTTTRAQALGLSLGDPLVLETQTGPHEGRLAGAVSVDDELKRRTLDENVFTLLEPASRILGQPGRLTRIDLTLPESPEERAAALQELGAALTEGARVVSAEARRQSTLRMTEAFELNLRALALLALLCGAFLVYGTITFSVVERRPQIGLLRALGVSRRAVLSRVLLDVGTLALTGTVLGIVGGVLLAKGLVRLVTRTVTDLYFSTAVRQLDLDPWWLAKALALGVTISIVAGLRPALEATRVQPRLSLRGSRQDEASNRTLAAVAGTVLLVLGVVGLAVAGRQLVASFGALFAAILGFALLVPSLVAIIMRSIEPVTRRRGTVVRMAARGLTRSLGRTGVALSALTLAVATTIGIGVMVGSFRESVAVWLGDTLRQDLYLSATLSSPTSSGAGDRVPFDPVLLEPVRDLPGIESLHSVRRVTIDSLQEGSGEAEPTEVTAIDTDLSGFAGYRLLGAQRRANDRLWPAFQGEETVLISEPLAFHRELSVGDTVTLETDRGAVSLPIVAVYRDYSSDRGEVLLHRRTWDRFFDDPRIDGVSIRASAGADDAELERLRNQVAEALPTSPHFEVRSARGLREAALEVFDRTFVITSVLRLLAGIVAFLGVLASLLALLLERRRQHAVLRAIGFSARELRRLLLIETSALGLIAGLLAVPLGLGLAWAMIHILNRRSFGWTMEMVISPGLLIQGIALAWLAATLAGVLPARKLARTSPAGALRAD